MPIRDRLSVRVLAFDRLTTQAGPTTSPVGTPNSNPRPSNEGVAERQPISDAQADRETVPAGHLTAQEGPMEASGVAATEVLVDVACSQRDTMIAPGVRGEEHPRLALIGRPVTTEVDQGEKQLEDGDAPRPLDSMAPTATVDDQTQNQSKGLGPAADTQARNMDKQMGRADPKADEISGGPRTKHMGHLLERRSRASQWIVRCPCLLEPNNSMWMESTWRTAIRCMAPWM